MKQSFNTKGESFDPSYQKNDILQKDFNAGSILKYARIISDMYFSQTVKLPLSIVDLCCGYGDPTSQLLEQLLANGVKIEKVTGYDVSQNMIDMAQSKYKDVSQLEFKMQDVEKMQDVKKYDVAVSLFGLHWMNDIDECANTVSRALKDNGKVLFLVPIEKLDLYEYRKDFIESSRWSECFDSSSANIRAFIFHKEEYIEPFNKYFKCVNEEKLTTIKNYSKNDFVKFLSSWMQEVRHICSDQTSQVKKDVLSEAYVSELIDSIPHQDIGNVVKSDGMVRFTEHTFEYEGIKLAGEDIAYDNDNFQGE